MLLTFLLLWLTSFENEDFCTYKALHWTHCSAHVEMRRLGSNGKWCEFCQIEKVLARNTGIYIVLFPSWKFYHQLMFLLYFWWSFHPLNYKSMTLQRFILTDHYLSLQIRGICNTYTVATGWERFSLGMVLNRTCWKTFSSFYWIKLALIWQYQNVVLFTIKVWPHYTKVRLHIQIYRKELKNCPMHSLCHGNLNCVGTLS